MDQRFKCDWNLAW